MEGPLNMGVGSDVTPALWILQPPGLDTVRSMGFGNGDGLLGIWLALPCALTEGAPERRRRVSCRSGGLVQ
jgi:hypothetical protein